jgi:hypothetical protein
VLELKYWPPEYLKHHIQLAVEAFKSRSDARLKICRKNFTWILCLNDIVIAERTTEKCRNRSLISL